MSRQFSSHQEFYPARGGGTLGADRKAATALVFQDVVAGVASTVAIQGDDGAIIAIQASALNTDNVIFNAATVYVAALGGGMIYVEESDYNLAATWNVSVDIFVQGAGWDAILNYNAGGNGITITGDNVKIRDLKIIIVAGAGAGGTRPNGILADTRTNLEIFGVWTIGDQTEADDGSDLRQCGVVFDTVTESRIINNRFEDNDRHGINLNASSDNNTVTGNTCQGNTQQGILLIASSDNNTVTGNTCQGNTQQGILLIASSDNNTVTGNTCQGNTQQGIILSSSSDNTVTGNTCQGNTQRGIFLSASSDNTVTGNTCQGNTQVGIGLSGSSNNNTVTGNTCNENSERGINLNASSDNTVTGNTCNTNVLDGVLLVSSSNNNTVAGNTCIGNDSGDLGTFSGITLNASDDNIIHSNTCNDNDDWGIDIQNATAERNWVKNNQLRGNTSGSFQDLGVGTKLATYSMPFIQGTTLISAAGNPWGWEIDLANEFAVTWGWLPLEVQQVVRIRVIAVGLSAPGAGNAMRLELTGEGATFDEVYTTNSIDVANHDTNETNFGVNDVIQWIFTVTDDPQIGTLLGGDRVQFEVLHEVAGNGNIATDAVFSSVEIEYV